jgi:hypothetical protein
MPNRKRHGQDFWRQHCRRWEGTELTQPEYCAANKISLKTFCRWRGLFKRNQDLGPPGNGQREVATAFVPVRVVSASARDDVAVADAFGEIRLRRDGAPWVVHIQPGFDTAALVEVLRAVALASQ